MTRANLRPWLGLMILPLALAGCLRFGEPPVASLMTLSVDAAVPAGTARSVPEGSAVTVAVPLVPQELATPRVPVATTGNALAYLKDARWSDLPARLFRDAVAETIAAQTDHAVLEPRQASLSPGMRLGGRLSQFGLNAATNLVVVRYDATLVRRPGATLETRRFEATAPAPVHEATPVAAALSAATNQIAAEVAEWVDR